MLEDKEKEFKIEKQVIHTGIVTDEELNDLYNLVDLLVFPSLYEGFGLPVIEAMACGTKVVSSNASSLPEVGGEYIPYFDPENVKEMADVIEKELLREETKEDREKRIKWARSFDGKKAALDTKNAIYSLKNSRNEEK